MLAVLMNDNYGHMSTWVIIISIIIKVLAITIILKTFDNEELLDNYYY